MVRESGAPVYVTDLSADNVENGVIWRQYTDPARRQAWLDMIRGKETHE